MIIESRGIINNNSKFKDQIIITQRPEIETLILENQRQNNNFQKSRGRNINTKRSESET